MSNTPDFRPEIRLALQRASGGTIAHYDCEVAGADGALDEFIERVERKEADYIVIYEMVPSAAAKAEELVRRAGKYAWEGWLVATKGGIEP